MQGLSVLIIEDDPIWQATLSVYLEEMGILEVHILDNTAEVKQFLTKITPDLVISDIYLGKHMVFELFDEILEFQSIPFVFITSSENKELYEFSKRIIDFRYLIKPFHQLSLKSAIESLQIEENKKYGAKEKYIVVRGAQNQKIQLNESDIMLVKSELNYCIIKTANKQFALKCSLSWIQEQLGFGLLQVHRSYLVNKKFIQKVSLSESVIVTSLQKISIGRKYKQNVMSFLNEKINL